MAGRCSQLDGVRLLSPELRDVDPVVSRSGALLDALHGALRSA